MLNARQFALHRGDVDDAAALARDHSLRHRLRDVEHAVEIGAHQLAPGLLRIVFEHAAPLDAGVVDENLDRPEVLLDLGHSLGGGIAVGDVEHGFEDLRAVAAQGGGGLGEGLRRAAVEDDARPCARKPLGQREADPCRGSRDERDRAAEPEQFGDELGHAASL